MLGIDRMLDIESSQNELYYLSAILTDNSLIHEVEIDSSYFQDKTSKQIFEAMKELSKHGNEINVISVSELLGGKVNLGYLLDLLDNGSVYKNSFKSIQNSIIKNWQRRKIAELLTNVSQSLINNVEPEKILNEIYLDIQQQGSKRDRHTFTMEEVLLESLNEIEEAYSKGGDISGLKSGYYRLDNLINGFEKKKYIIIGARPAVGKTAVSLEIAKKLAINKARGIFFSVEMAKENLGKRYLASTSYINSYKVNAGKLTDDEFNKVTNCAARLSALPLIVNDKAGITVEEICRIATKEKYSNGLDFIMVDYLQLLKTENKNCNTEKMKVDEVSGQLRELAKRLDICVICLAQLNRGVEGRADKKPQVSDLKESGNIEQDANIILLLHAEKDKDDTPITFQDGSEKLNIIIGKNRDGQLKTLVYGYYKQYQRIEEKGIETIID